MSKDDLLKSFTRYLLSRVVHVPLSTEFTYLSKTQNLAAIECLARLLHSDHETTRWQAASALSARTDQASLERFLAAFDAAFKLPCREWKTLGYRLLPILPAILEDPRHPLYRSALKATADCEIASAFPKLVRNAEQVGSAHGAFAGKQLIEMAARLGAEVRVSGVESSNREILLKLLYQSLKDFSTHRSSAIAEAALVCFKSDDALLQSILNQTEEQTLKILVRQWRTTQRYEALELLVSLLGRHFLPRSITDLIFKVRKDAKMALALARGAQEGLIPQSLQRFNQNGVPACCPEIKTEDASLNQQEQWQLWKIMAAGNVPLSKLLEGVASILSDSSIESQQAAADVIRHYPPPGYQKVLEGMAPSVFANESEEGRDHKLEDPDGTLFRERMRKLLSFKDTGEANLKAAIEDLFADFSVRVFIEHIDVLIEDALQCFAEVLRGLRNDWHQQLMPWLEASDPKRRCQAVIAASYLGPHPALKLSLQKLLQDKFEIIREEAEFALQHYKKEEPVPIPPSLPGTLKPTMNGATV